MSTICEVGYRVMDSVPMFEIFVIIVAVEGVVVNVIIISDWNFNVHRFNKARL